MAKFPSQKLMTYDTPNLSNDSLTDCGVLSIPKDLSIYNRRGYASTTRSGTPLIYRMRFNLYSMTRAGQRPGLDADDAGSTSADSTAETVPSADFTTLLRVTGCQNNWTMKNAAEEYHKAREQMFRDAGVKKSGRGAYSHEIRYCYITPSETLMTPTDGDGADLVGGTWDISQLAYASDNEFALSLVGDGDDEESDSFSGDELQIGHSYLLSRLNQQVDTNLESEEGPAKNSVLRQMLEGSLLANSTVDDDIATEARDAQDNPPYEVLDLSASGDVGHDITEPVLLGQGVTSISTPVASFICDVPFGIAKIQARHSGAADQNIVDPVFFTAEVLKISEMQG